MFLCFDKFLRCRVASLFYSIYSIVKSFNGLSINKHIPFLYFLSSLTGTIDNCLLGILWSLHSEMFEYIFYTVNFCDPLRKSSAVYKIC